MPLRFSVPDSLRADAWALKSLNDIERLGPCICVMFPLCLQI